MTERLPYSEMRRKNRRWGEQLFVMECPLGFCRGEARPVVYRRNTVRLECRQCGLRYSINGRDFDVRFDAFAERLRSSANSAPVDNGVPARD